MKPWGNNNHTLDCFLFIKKTKIFYLFFLYSSLSPYFFFLLFVRFRLALTEYNKLRIYIYIYPPPHIYTHSSVLYALAAGLFAALGRLSSWPVQVRSHFVMIRSPSPGSVHGSDRERARRALRVRLHVVRMVQKCYFVIYLCLNNL